MTAKSLVSCSLCGLTTLHPLTNERGDVFCCPSCREVAALLAENPPAMAAPAQVEEGSDSVTLMILTMIW